VAAPFDPASGLAGLLAPFDRNLFLTKHWDAAPLQVTGGGHDFTNLISIARMDALIAEQVFNADQLSMARSEPRLSPEAYLAESGLADPGLVARRYQEGATLILPQLHRRERALADLCRSLEVELGHPVQTNIYLTPPTAQGFQTHYDTHDVFILQVEGAKRWRLYDAPAGAVYRGEGFEPGAVTAGDISAEFVLQPGDVAYVPRGLMHDAVNEGENEASLHVTVGVLARTWADFVLEAVGEAALKTPTLRTLLPAHVSSAEPDLETIRSVFDAALQSVREHADLEAVAGLFADRFVTGRTPDTAGAIVSAAHANQMKIRRRPLVPLHLAEDGNHVALVAPGGPVSFDPPAEPALERLIAGETISAIDFAELGEVRAADAIARLIAFGAAVEA
jgi:ribosomal protein L16 Arg81 hydroxylase